MGYVRIIPANTPFPLSAAVAGQVVEHSYNPGVDAFARFRVSEPVTLLDSTLQYGLQPNVWESVLAGAGQAAHVAHQSSCKMSVGTASGDKVVRQSRRYPRYNPGKSHLVLTTGVIGAAKANVRKRIGLFDDQNGVFFEQTSEGMFVVQRTYTSGTASDAARVAQASWNIDTMDGNGPSGLTLDPTKANIYGWVLEWLGVGVTTAFVVIGGALYACHRFQNANALDKVYMTTASLPVRYEIENTGIAATGTDMYQICATVVSEGGSALSSGSAFGVSNGTTPRTVAARLPVLTIRPDATFNGVVNRVTILPTSVDLYVASPSSNPVYWELVRGGTTAGGTWGTADANSAVVYNTGGTAITGGQVIACGYDKPTGGGGAIDLSAYGNSDLALTLDAAGANPQELTIVATGISGAVSVAASLTYFEAK